MALAIRHIPVLFRVKSCDKSFVKDFTSVPVQGIIAELDFRQRIIKKLKAEVIELTGQVRTLKEQKNKLLQQITSKNEENERLIKDLHSNAALVRSLHQEISELTLQVKRLNEQITAKNEEIDCLIKDVHSKATLVTSLRQEISELTLQVKRLNEQVIRQTHALQDIAKREVEEEEAFKRRYENILEVSVEHATFFLKENVKIVTQQCQALKEENAKLRAAILCSGISSHLILMGISPKIPSSLRMPHSLSSHPSSSAVRSQSSTYSPSLNTIYENT